MSENKTQFAVRWLTHTKLMRRASPSLKTLADFFWNDLHDNPDVKQVRGKIAVMYEVAPCFLDVVNRLVSLDVDPQEVFHTYPEYCLLCWRTDSKLPIGHPFLFKGEGGSAEEIRDWVSDQVRKRRAKVSTPSPALQESQKCFDLSDLAYSKEIERTSDVVTFSSLLPDHTSPEHHQETSLNLVRNLLPEYDWRVDERWSKDTHTVLEGRDGDMFVRLQSSDLRVLGKGSWTYKMGFGDWRDGDYIQTGGPASGCSLRLVTEDITLSKGLIERLAVAFQRG